MVHLHNVFEVTVFVSSAAGKDALNGWYTTQTRRPEASIEADVLAFNSRLRSACLLHGKMFRRALLVLQAIQDASSSR